MKKVIILQRIIVPSLEGVVEVELTLHLHVKRFYHLRLQDQLGLGAIDLI